MTTDLEGHLCAAHIDDAVTAAEKRLMKDAAQFVQTTLAYLTNTTGVAVSAVSFELTDRRTVSDRIPTPIVTGARIDYYIPDTRRDTL